MTHLNTPKDCKNKNHHGVIKICINAKGRPNKGIIDQVLHFSDLRTPFKNLKCHITTKRVSECKILSYYSVLFVVCRIQLKKDRRKGR